MGWVYTRFRAPLSVLCTSHNTLPTQPQLSAASTCTYPPRPPHGQWAPAHGFWTELFRTGRGGKGRGRDLLSFHSIVTFFSCLEVSLGFLIFLLLLLSRVLVVARGLFSWGMQDLVPWPGMEPKSPALWVQSLSHRITRDIPGSFSNPHILCCCCSEIEYTLYKNAQKYIPTV